jgi:hypothetical protein
MSPAHFRACKCRITLDIIDVFDGHGNSVQRTAVTAIGDLFLCSPSTLAGFLIKNADHSLKLLVMATDPTQTPLNQLHGRDGPLGK